MCSSIDKFSPFHLRILNVPQLLDLKFLSKMIHIFTLNPSNVHPVGIYLFKDKNENTTPEQCVKSVQS